MLQLGLQVVGIVFLVSTMTSWGKAGGKSPSAPAGAAVDPDSDGFASSMESAAKLARATQAPTPPSAADNPLASFFGMAFSPTVHPALQEFEAIRKRALDAVPAGRVLPQLWPQGTGFDMYVFLSTSSSPDLDFTMPDALDAGQAAFRVKESSASAPQTSFTLLGTLSEVWEKGFIGRAITAISRGESVFKAASKEATGTASGSADGQPGEPEATNEAPAWEALRAAGGAADQEATALLWHASDLKLASGATSGGSLLVNVSLPAAVRDRNATLVAHVLLCAVPPGGRRGARDVSCTDHPERFVRVLYPVVLHRPKKQQAELRSLLDDASQALSEGAGAGEPKPRQQPSFGIGAAADASGEDESDDGADVFSLAGGAAGGSGRARGADASSASGADGEAGDGLVLPYWRPTLHVATVVDSPTLQKGKIPPHVPDLMQVTPDGQGYVPLTLVNDWWLLSSRLREVNATTESMPLEVSWEGVSLMYWTLMTQWTSQSATQQSLGVQREGEAEMLKQVVLETNPWLLGLTFVVSTLHMVFEFLAFRADISFWRRAKTMEGLSVKSILINVVVQVVILLYLFDNNTSWMILLSNCVGTAIEVWKLRKAVAVSLSWVDGWPKLNWADKDDGYVRSKTKQYDDEAISNLGAIALPLMLGYAGYSLFYARHKSWYSWVLSSLVGFVYAFGFVLLVPQVYLNYKLRSVAHMPWKAMVYKSLNTFVDDIFAFVIPAPTLHRLATFRDDIIFFVYLYQRCAYPVDTKRVNEFGMSGEDELRALEKAQGLKRTPRRLKTDKHAYVGLVETGTLACRPT